MYCMDSEKVGRLTVKVYQDENCPSPLEDDRLGTMYLFHDRYSIGDKHGKDLETARAFCTQDSRISFPVFIYDHSGVALSTESFEGRAPHAAWDSGRVGWITVSKEKVRKEFDCKIVGKRIREMVYKYLTAEVEDYGKWLNGECWGFEVIDENDVVVDSCWGYIGSPEYTMKDGVAAAEHILAEEETANGDGSK